jgi:hypothetical protein
MDAALSVSTATAFQDEYETLPRCNKWSLAESEVMGINRARLEPGRIATAGGDRAGKFVCLSLSNCVELSALGVTFVGFRLSGSAERQ